MIWPKFDKGKVVAGSLFSTRSFLFEAARQLLTSRSFGNELQDFCSRHNHLETALQDY